jgi:hypothetical protein
MAGSEKKMMPAMQILTSSTAPTTGIEKKYRPITSTQVRITRANRIRAARPETKRLADSANRSMIFITPVIRESPQIARAAI